MKRYRFNYKPKTTPKEHQESAIESKVGDKPLALFDEQGLGKTKIVIDILCRDIKNGLIDGAIIVCTKTLITTWSNEIKSHSHLYSMELTGNKYDRKRYMATFAHFYIIGYESFIQELEYIREFLSIRHLALVLDEANKIKNPASKITGTIFSVKNLAKKRIIITGTPVANKPEDIWSQIYFLDDGERLGRNFKGFRKEYGIDISMGKHKINEKSLHELKIKISDISIRRRKSELPNLDIPPKNPPKNVYVTLPDRQRALYNKLRKSMLLEIKNLSGEMISDNSSNILKRLLRLIQIASNPFLIDKSFLEEPIKFHKIDGLLKEIIDKHEKVIIWTVFVDNILILKRRYKKYGAVTIFGGMTREQKDRSVTRFQSDPECSVLIANPSAAGVGLTLTAGNNAIYLDRNFSLSDYLQSQDRIHRIGQKKRCNIIRIIAKNTVDEYVDDIIEKKHNIARIIQGDTQVLRKQQEFLSKAELMKIIGKEG